MSSVSKNTHISGDKGGGGVTKCWLQSRGHRDQGQANFGLTVEVVHVEVSCHVV